MATSGDPVLESRLGPKAAYLVPIALTGGALLLLVAWLVLNALGSVTPDMGIVGIVFALGAAFSLIVATFWLWNSRRTRLVVTTSELTVVQALGSPQTVSLDRLGTVEVQLLPNSSTRAILLTDADGRSVQVGLGAWEREAEILRLIAETARRTGAPVSPDAQIALSGPDTVS